MDNNLTVIREALEWGDDGSHVYENARAALSALEDELKAREWQDISTAQELDRVFVSGYQKPSGNVAGYWWVHEDVIVNGKPLEHPSATKWQPLPKPPSCESKNGEGV
jgi:hypothetical protein